MIDFRLPRNCLPKPFGGSVGDGIMEVLEPGFSHGIEFGERRAYVQGLQAPCRGVRISNVNVR